jgi:uridylate kinase
MDFKVIHIDETDSTNRWLKENGKGNMVVVTDYQTAGKGCGTNTWESERGKNLTFSMLIHPEEIPAVRQFLISEIVSVALCETLASVSGESFTIKWPNDIYHRDQKLCGILIENQLQGSTIKDSIIGIGINVNQEVFLSDAPNPVSLRQIVGQEVDLEALFNSFIQRFEEVFHRDVETVSADYRRLLYRKDSYYEYEDSKGRFEAKLLNVLNDGHLVLLDIKGTARIYAFKEVSYIINKRYMAKFNRILLKLSGESLMGKQGYGIDPERLSDYAKQIKEVSEMGVQIGIVIGGGNIFRGLSGSQKGFDRVKGDQMGMCATVINSLALSSALGAVGVKNKVLTAIRMEPIGEFYTKWKAIEAMEAGYVCIFSAGTGSPYFTTDTGSSLRGIEIEADVMLKGTRVDGVYTADPEKDPTATKFDEITYKEVLARGLKVMDLTAICMCQDNNLPIYVFNMDIVGNLKKVMDGEPIGTLVHN